MKTKLSPFHPALAMLRRIKLLSLVFGLLSFIFYPLSSQVPQGFNYQAIARDAGGNLITAAFDIKVEIQNLAADTVFWIEEHTVTPNEYGLISFVVGQSGRIGGTALLFEDIDWASHPRYLKTSANTGSGYTVMGIAQIMSVPYSLVAREVTGPVDNLNIAGTTEDMDEALFEVRNKDGQVIFAVYNEGVRIYVDDEAKGPKGGFAIGSFGINKEGESQPLFIVKPDTVRIYINQTGKGPKGGFAIGGYGIDKTEPQNFLFVSDDSVRIYIDNADDDYPKGVKGGFAIGGYGLTKGGQKLMTVSDDSVRIYIDDGGKGPKGGFAIGGFDKTKGEGNNANFFNVSTSAQDTIDPAQNRILWYPVKNAFLTGRVLVEHPDSVGENSFASGFESKAKGQYSQAMGYQAVARGMYSTSIGYQSVASKDNSFAFGQWAMAKNFESYAFGRGATAEGFRSFAFGSAGIDSLGQVTDAAYAKGDYSFAIGQGSQSLGMSSFAIGLADTARGWNATAFGYKTVADGNNAFSTGSYTIASGITSFTGGYKTEARGNSSLAFGSYSVASENNAFAIGSFTLASGYASFASGVGSEATGYTSFAGGYGSQAICIDGISLAYGLYSVSSGYTAVALGNKAVAKGFASFAMGDSTVASKDWSVALGRWTKASETCAVAIGSETLALGDASFAGGYRSQSSGSYSFSFGSRTSASGNFSFAAGDSTYAVNACSATFGSRTQANADCSFAIGYKSNTSGWSSFAGGDNSTANGSTAFSFGFNCTASGSGSVAFGNNSSSTGIGSFAVGNYSIASGNNSNALGWNTIAPSALETVVGSYNTVYTPLSSTVWNGADRLFVIGNGTSDGARSNAVTVLKNGNVGIGINAPVSKLDINGRARFYNGGDTPGILLMNAANTSDEVFVGMYDDNNFGILDIGTAWRLIINNTTGNIGIGTTSPLNRLSVAGLRSNTINSANAIAHIGGGDVYTYFGALDGSPSWNTWIQPLRSTDNVPFGLSLCPVGGSVGIGTASPSEKLYIEGNTINNGNLGIGAAGFGGGVKVISIENGTVPTSSIPNGILLYAEDVLHSTPFPGTWSELKVRDEFGAVTTLSPHNFSLTEISEPMAWSFYSENHSTGQKINVDMLKAVRLIEQLSGEKLVYIEDFEGNTVDYSSVKYPINETQCSQYTTDDVLESLKKQQQQIESQQQIIDQLSDLIIEMKAEIASLRSQ